MGANGRVNFSIDLVQNWVSLVINPVNYSGSTADVPFWIRRTVRMQFHDFYFQYNGHANTSGAILGHGYLCNMLQYLLAGLEAATSRHSPRQIKLTVVLNFSIYSSNACSFQEMITLVLIYLPCCVTCM